MRLDRQNFGPRFDHPDFHRAPPGMYDEPPPHMRHRGGRFDDRRRPPRPDFGYENPTENDRFQKRSRWGESYDENNSQEIEDLAPNGEENKGGNTPLHDEPLNRDVIEEPQAEEVPSDNIVPPSLEEKNVDQPPQEEQVVE